MVHRSQNPVGCGEQGYFNEKRPVNLRVDRLSNLVRNVPFFGFVSGSFFVDGPARSVALRSPKGGAFRAKRRAGPSTAAPPSPPSSFLVAACLDGPPRATGGCSGAPISAVPAAAAVRGSVPRRAWPAARSVSRAPLFPATAAPARDTRWRCSRAALRTPALCSAPTHRGGPAPPVGTTDSGIAPPRHG